MVGLYKNGKIRIKEDDTRTGAYTRDGAWRVEDLSDGPFVTRTGARRKDLVQKYYNTIDETSSGLTLTAGTDETNVGYNDAAVGGTPFGSISAQPVEGQTLNVLQILSGTYLQIYFTGDLSAYEDTITVTVGSDVFVGIDAAIKADTTGGFSMWAWADPPSIVDTETYTFSITL